MYIEYLKSICLRVIVQDNQNFMPVQLINGDISGVGQAFVIRYSGGLILH